VTEWPSFASRASYSLGEKVSSERTDSIFHLVIPAISSSGYAKFSIPLISESNPRKANSREYCDEYSHKWEDSAMWHRRRSTVKDKKAKWRVLAPITEDVKESLKGAHQRDWSLILDITPSLCVIQFRPVTRLTSFRVWRKLRRSWFCANKIVYD